jgi:hypothetical protein
MVMPPSQSAQSIPPSQFSQNIPPSQLIQNMDLLIPHATLSNMVHQISRAFNIKEGLFTHLRTLTGQALEVQEAAHHFWRSISEHVKYLLGF